MYQKKNKNTKNLVTIVIVKKVFMFNFAGFRFIETFIYLFISFELTFEM